MERYVEEALAEVGIKVDSPKSLCSYTIPLMGPSPELPPMLYTPSSRTSRYYY